jgi:hypothetical protein
MGKQSKNDKKSKSMLDSDGQPSGFNGQSKIGKKQYEAEIFKLQVELVKLQEWVKAKNARIVILRRKGCCGQRWSHQAHHGACQPADLSSGRPPGADRKAENTAPCSALH